MTQQSAIVLLERRSVVPKRTWRDPAFRRTLEPMDIAGQIAAAWKSCRSEAGGLSSMTITLALDGSVIGAPAISPMREQQSGFAGAFELSFHSPDSANVILREEECARQIGAPGHRTRHIALLRPWRPVRILLNGRYAGHRGQFYELLEYHLTLCTGPMPRALPPARFIDLQADLF